MKRFYAILRDSYREAVSTWVIPVMVVFTLLLMVLIGSVSFRPIQLNEELPNRFRLLNFGVRANSPNVRDPGYSVENYSATNPTVPWQSDYQFDVVYRSSDEFYKRLESNPGFPLTARRLRNYLQGNDGVPYLENIAVTDVTPKPPEPPKAEAKADAKADAAKGGKAALPAAGEAGVTERRFRVTTQGTKAKDVTMWVHQPSFFFGGLDYIFTYTLRDGVYKLEKNLVNDAGTWVILLVSVVITAGFIPNMLRKGAIDLYISKPIGRVPLLVSKYLGGLILVLLLTTLLVTGVWLVIGARTGFWSPKFLLLIPLMTFYFAVLYAVSTLFAVLTRSTLVAILMTILAWGVLVGVGYVKGQIRKVDEANDKAMAAMNIKSEDDDVPRFEVVEVNKYLRWVVNGLYYPSPRTTDIDDYMIQSIADGVLTDVELKQRGLDSPLPDPWQTFGVSLAFIAVCLGLASLRMVTRDD